MSVTHTDVRCPFLAYSPIRNTSSNGNCNWNPIENAKEFDQLNKILSVVGTPEFNDWPEGYALIQKLNVRMPNYNKSNLGQKVFNANGDAINFLEKIFQLDYRLNPQLI